MGKATYGMLVNHHHHRIIKSLQKTLYKEVSGRIGGDNSYP